MNVLKNKIVAQVSAVVLLITLTATPNSASASVEKKLVVGNPTSSGFAQVISEPQYTVGQFIFYPTDDGLAHLSSGFGGRAKACGACSTWHIGADFTAGYGSAVRSVSSGVVEYVGWQSGSGFVIEIRHDDIGDVVTVYAHLISKSNTVKVGDTVRPNQKIAKIGQTGVATAPHLHLEIWVNGNVVNPVTWLKKNNASN